MSKHTGPEAEAELPTGLRLINFGIAAEATVGKYMKIERLPREVKIFSRFYMHLLMVLLLRELKQQHANTQTGPNGPQPSVCVNILL